MRVHSHAMIDTARPRPPLRLYDVTLENGCTLSPFVWRIRYALAHKGLDYETEPVAFTGIRKIHGGKPIYKLDSTLDVAVVLLLGVAKADGDITSDQKQFLLALFQKEFELSRPRWYWFDEKPVVLTQTYKISYTPLLRQYRLTSGNGNNYQNFTRYWLEAAAHRLGADVVEYHALGGAWSTIASRVLLQYPGVFGVST